MARILLFIDSFAVSFSLLYIEKVHTEQPELVYRLVEQLSFQND